MDNLITAIIATALLAAIAVMSANYGAEAIQNWQAKMDATRIVGDAKNIAEAWREFTRASNGDPSFGDGYYWGNPTSDLVPNYLGTMPLPPKGSVSSAAPYYYPIVAKNYALSVLCGSVVLTSKRPADTIALQVQSPKVCTAIATLAGYSGATAKASSIFGDLTAATSRRPYDCIYVDNDSSGAPSQGDTMLFIYRVFDQNNFTVSNNVVCP